MYPQGAGVQLGALLSRSLSKCGNFRRFCVCFNSDLGIPTSPRWLPLACAGLRQPDQHLLDAREDADNGAKRHASRAVAWDTAEHGSTLRFQRRGIGFVRVSLPLAAGLPNASRALLCSLVGDFIRELCI